MANVGGRPMPEYRPYWEKDAEHVDRIFDAYHATMILLFFGGLPVGAYFGLGALLIYGLVLMLSLTFYLNALHHRMWDDD